MVVRPQKPKSPKKKAALGPPFRFAGFAGLQAELDVEAETGFPQAAVDVSAFDRAVAELFEDEAALIVDARAHDFRREELRIDNLAPVIVEHVAKVVNLEIEASNEVGRQRDLLADTQVEACAPARVVAIALREARAKKPSPSRSPLFIA